MVEYFPFVWLLIAFLIPITCLIIGLKLFTQNNKTKDVLIKLFVVFLLYLPVTIFCALYAASLVNSFEDAKGTITNGVRGVPALDLATIILFSGHIIFGLVLCWFVNKDWSKILNRFNDNQQITRTIFDKE